MGGSGVPTLADRSRSGTGKSDFPGSVFAGADLFAAAGLVASDLPASNLLASVFGKSVLLRSVLPRSGFFNSGLGEALREPNVDGVGMVTFGVAASGAGGRNGDLVDPSGGCGGKPVAMRGRLAAFGSAAVDGREGSPPEAPSDLPALGVDAADARGRLEESLDEEGVDAPRVRAGSRPLPSGGVLPEFTASAPALTPTMAATNCVNRLVTPCAPHGRQSNDFAGLPPNSQAESDRPTASD